VLHDGDAWATIDASATPLTGERHAVSPARTPSPSEVPEALRVYASKRSFSETPEPPPEGGTGTGDAFVIHRHHASRLHYDLRLEREGTLKSWAIPKGLPPRPGVKRLGVATENHPLKYLSFQGIIPKGQYGAGRMWVFAAGKYEITQEKKDGFYLSLRSRQVSGEYRCINTRGTDWLVMRVDAPQVDWLRDPVEPMLAESRQEPPASDGYLYEVKWDGIRALVSLDDGALTIRSRSRRDITALFPELRIPEQAFRAASALFDAEIVCLDPNGRPIFQDVVTRLHHSGDVAIERARTKHPAVCYLFDCLYLDGRTIIDEPLYRRREWLADAVRDNPTYRVSETLEDGTHLFDAARRLGLEGIMAKRADSPYLPGKRTSSWLKIKVRQTADCVVIGYTRGKGDRGASFGALHLGRFAEGALRYSGKVGTGFDDGVVGTIMAELKNIPAVARPVPEKPLDDAQSTWVEPKLVCEVRYASLTRDGILREPVFVRLRPDLVPEDCS
jgi:DNA ligase D-like protein (predicted ligase)/DNA ligase D-like protein (predicted 3'-phosphoesterase)